MNFDPASEAHVALMDEMPLWSSLAGALLLDLVPLASRRVLDLGCGTGFPLLEIAERLGPETLVAGLDPWRPALVRALAKREAWPVPHAGLVCGDGAAMPFRDGEFDLVVSNLGVNNFEPPGRALEECRRVLSPGGALVLSTNLVGHFAELYEAFAAVLEREGDAAALARLRAHVAHRATVPGLHELLARHGLRVETVLERRAAWRFRDGGALLGHHFMRLGFVPAWREVAGGPFASLEPLRHELDARAGAAGLSLTVPLAALLARPA